jgi:hypothetical protein
MGLSREIPTEDALQERDVARLIRAKAGVLAANWRDRQVSATLPRVLQLIDEQRALTNKLDYNALVEQVWAETTLVGLLG